LADRIIVLSKIPSTIKKIIEVKMPRPRDYMDKNFLKLRDEIENLMEMPI
jgi:NitT/TauT family transport system ATP-binding protein/sulfonate transport system ATP-binding protein